jgi:signal peptidase II
MTKVRAYAALAGLAGLVVALDQTTKYLVRSRIDFGGSWSPIPALSEWVRVVHWTNTGAAFGLFPSGGLIFTIVAVVVSGAILYYYPRIPAGHFLLKMALILQLGGALGNLADRLFQSTVTDFIAVGHFPVFNIADACISLGVALLVISMWMDERKEAAPGIDADGGPRESADSPADLPRMTG